MVLGAMICGISSASQAVWAQTETAEIILKVDPAHIEKPVSPMLYGMMTEEINHAFDGGLYAELLQNRTFRNTWLGLDHWDLVRNGKASAAMKLDEGSGPSKALPHSLELTVTSASVGTEAGVSNSGYWGIPVRPHTTYKGSFYAKVDEASPGPVTARLVSDKTGTVLAEAKVELHSGPWAKYEYTLKVEGNSSTSTNHLQLTVTHAGRLWLQLASLMPPTYKGRANGNRPDLMEKMAALHPHFLRLPGGNYLEGDQLRDWYNWKETIGPLADRPGHQAPWTYWSTDGLGLLEFLEWCEDLNIEPVLAVYAGYALQGAHIAPGKDLDPYVQSAVDEVEYVTGSTTTKWGAERAKDGHPAPFPLHYIEIGNEDWFDKSGSYDGRFAQFAKALHRTYPQYKLIATAPVKEADADAQPDVLDEHFYKQPAEMMDFAHHYDTAARTGPKIFVGEWASMAGTPTPNFASALGDAAFMTGFERNSDLIVMASYAPLLVNINPGGLQWTPDLIGFDALNSYASPSYWAQALFAGHWGDGVPQSTVTGDVANPRFFYSVTLGSADHMLHLKLVNASTFAQPLSLLIAGSARTATVTSLHAATYEATNSMSEPNRIEPKTHTEAVAAETWKHIVPALSIEVIDLPIR